MGERRGRRTKKRTKSLRTGDSAGPWGVEEEKIIKGEKRLLSRGLISRKRKKKKVTIKDRKELFWRSEEDETQNRLDCCPFGDPLKTAKERKKALARGQEGRRVDEKKWCSDSGGGGLSSLLWAGVPAIGRRLFQKEKNSEDRKERKNEQAHLRRLWGKKSARRGCDSITLGSGRCYGSTLATFETNRSQSFRKSTRRGGGKKEEVKFLFLCRIREFLGESLETKPTERRGGEDRKVHSTDHGGREGVERQD